ncbi:sugar phosphate isomerase [Actinoplanes sp. OR16]|uniref:sugar phosphate isomerase/epimerase family protein n=1 Tax=Actinoplanes sp. OR16 TaxID=946334 RepID=UPI000F6CEA6E|nr:TIM barrel protein [Actinoplanes sp. OR16]BBH69076.1 sugar phosphate isomerase [Actinoplanes sp. OR16]
MTAVGSDIRYSFGGHDLWKDGFELLDSLTEQGLDGCNIRTLDELAPTLDQGYLAELAAHADQRGLYVEMGIGKVNPFMTAELPRVRALGDGDYLAGMTRMIETCARHGWTTLWTACGGIKGYPGIYATDRFRTDVDWSEQLRVTEAFLRRLAPVLRANGCRLGIETHEEITTFEVIRLVEAAGPDVLGICLDPGNLPANGESPSAGIERVAPYVISTQLRDVALFQENPDLVRFLAPCGDGVIDWAWALDLLLTANPQLNLTIEGIGGIRGELHAQVTDPVWLAGHPDLSAGELTELGSLVGKASEDLTTLRTTSDRWRPLHDRFVSRSATHLRSVLELKNV